MTKWDDLVEVAAHAVCPLLQEDEPDFTGCMKCPARESNGKIEGARGCRWLAARLAGAALRALLAKGIKFVPGEPTYRMQEAAVFCDSDRWPTVIKAVIDAGSIKPEGE